MENMVSIIIPCYNLEKYIFECLKSIEKLNYYPLEVIVVDDGSKDKSVEIISRFIQENNNFGEKQYTLIKQKNGGASSARNTGLLHAKGEYIAFIDGDDTIDADYITNMVQAMKFTNMDLCVSGVREVDESGSQIKDFILEQCKIYDKDDLLLKIDKQDFILCNLYCKLYRRDIIENYKIKMDTRLTVGEDISFNLDYYKVINSLIIINDCSYNYRIRSGSLIHNVTLPTKQKFVLQHFLDFFQDYSPEFIRNSLKHNPLFTHLFWVHGILNYVQAQILEKRKFQTIYELVPVRCALELYKPESKKDLLLYFCLKNKFYALIKILVLVKYKILLPNRKIYDTVKYFFMK